MSAEQELYELEEEFDRQILGLRLWNLPLRGIYTLFGRTVDAIQTGGRFTRSAAPRDGAALLSRMSYLMENFQRASLELDDPPDEIIADYREDFRNLVGYAHFCEIMPDVRKGSLQVSKTKEGFRLYHGVDNFAKFEEIDVLMTELSLASDTSLPSREIAFFDRHIVRAKGIGQDGKRLITKWCEHFLRNTFEESLVPENNFTTCFGFERSDFLKVRAAFSALSLFCDGLSEAAARRFRKGGGQDQSLVRLGSNWMTPLMGTEYFESLVTGATGLSRPTLQSVLRPLSVDTTAGTWSQSGDGYLPPIVRYPNHVLFIPLALRAMLPERNLLYVSNRTDRDHFDRVISPLLEPVLLNRAEQALSQIGSFITVKNVTWRKDESNGEIDLLVYDPDANEALQVQAKAAIPAQGARMTRQLETHTNKAIDQLMNFMHTPSDFRDEVCSRAINNQVSNVTWRSAVLSRSGFGTAGAWSRLGDAIPLNLALLKGAVKLAMRAKEGSIEKVLEKADELLQDGRKIFGGWQHSPIELFGTTIDIPLLDVDKEKRDKIWMKCNL